MNLGCHFPCATSAKIPRSMYARVPQVMAQFVLKIEKLSHIMGPTPILEMARAYGLRPRLWLLMRDNPGRLIESNTKNSWLRYLNNMSIQGTWADALIIQTVADVLKATIQIVESNHGFAPLTTVYPVQERNTSSTFTIGHIGECHYVSTTALQSNASISLCNELTDATQSSRNKHFIMSIYAVCP